MTPRSLMILIIRVLGIFSLKELLNQVPQLASMIISFFMGYSMSDGFFMFSIALLTVVFFMWISYMLIFKADMLVTKFGLDKNYTEPVFDLHISISSVLRIAIIVTGGLLLISEIPEFCRMIYLNLTMGRMTYFQTPEPDWSPVLFSGVKILIALLLIGERKRVLAFLEKTPEQEKTATPE